MPKKKVTLHIVQTVFFLSVSSFWPEQAVMLIRLYCMLIVKSGYTRTGFPLPSVYPHILLLTPLYIHVSALNRLPQTLHLAFSLYHSRSCFLSNGSPFIRQVHVTVRVFWGLWKRELMWAFILIIQLSKHLCVSHTVDPKHKSKISRSVVIITSRVWITAAEVLWRLQAWLEECCLWIRQEFGANAVFFSSKCLVSRRFLDSFWVSGKYRIQAR